MSETGKNIVHMMGEMKKLFLDIALLLKTADEHMKKMGWTSRSNTCVSMSYTLDMSSYWFPKFAFRFYKNDGYKHILPFITVVFDDREEDTYVEEPLLTAGWHDYGKGNEVGQNYELDYANWHIYMPERRDDGTLVVVDPRQEWPQYNYSVQKTTTMAIPLTSITNAEQLKARIIDPLVAGIQEEGG